MPDVSPKEILEMLIEENLILEKAYRVDISAAESEIERQLDQVIQNISSRFPSHQEFLLALENEGLTLDKLKKQYREQISRQIIKDKILNQEVFAKISATEFEKKNFYETHIDSFPKRPKTVKVGEIIIKPKAGPQARAEAMDRIQKLKVKLDRGADFEDLAKKNSECPSASKGGNLGYFSKGDMVKPFEKAAFNLDIGEVSEPVLTKFGYHLIRLDDKHDGEVKVHHILIKTKLEKSARKAAKRKIKEAYAKLQKGEGFIEVAEEYSDTLKEESIEDFTIEYPADRISEVPQVGNIFKSLEPGDFSEIIESDGKYFIYANLGSLPERTYKYDEITTEIKNMVMQKKRQQAMEKWLKELKKEIYVKVYE